MRDTKDLKKVFENYRKEHGISEPESEQSAKAPASEEGRKSAKKASQPVDKKVDEVAEDIKNAADKVNDTVLEAIADTAIVMEKADEALSDGEDKITEAVSKSVADVKADAEKSFNEMSEKFDARINELSDKTEAILEEKSEDANTFKEKVSASVEEKVDDAKAAVDSAVSDIENAIDTAEAKVDEMITEAAGSIEMAKADISDAIEEAKNAGDEIAQAEDGLKETESSSNERTEEISEEKKGRDEPGSSKDAEVAAEVEIKPSDSEATMVAVDLPPNGETASNGLKMAHDEAVEINDTIDEAHEFETGSPSLDILLAGAPVIRDSEDKNDEDDTVFAFEEIALESPEIGSEDDFENATEKAVEDDTSDVPETNEDEVTKKGKNESAVEIEAEEQIPQMDEEPVVDEDIKGDDIFTEPEETNVEGDEYGIPVPPRHVYDEEPLDLSDIPSLDDEEAASSLERLADLAKMVNGKINADEDILGDTDVLSIDEINSLLEETNSLEIPERMIESQPEPEYSIPFAQTFEPKENMKEPVIIKYDESTVQSKAEKPKRPPVFIYLLIVILFLVLAVCMLHMLGIIDLSSILNI